MSQTNPFDAATDPDRHFIWQRLMIADTEAFVAGDFSMIENDFDAENFEGVRCFLSDNPDDWKVAFPDLASYRDAWLAASQEWSGKPADEARRQVLSRAVLNQIDIVGERALAHKQFIAAGRQTIYRLHRRGGTWKIVGFLGFLRLTSKRN
jgi:hypothetical protein